MWGGLVEDATSFTNVCCDIIHKIALSLPTELSPKTTLLVRITRDVPRPRTQPHCSVAKRISHARAIGGCSSNVNTLDAWSAISNPRSVLQSAALPFPLYSWASLPPFHCSGIVPLATTRFMRSVRSSASLSPPSIQISLASASQQHAASACDTGPWLLLRETDQEWC